MKKLLLILLAMTAVIAYGNPVDVTTAKQIAEHFYSANVGKNVPVNMLNVTSQTDFHEFYIFRNTAGKGFVMVSADDCVWPILGYSLDNDMELPLPDNVASYFEGYEQEIAYVKSQNFPQTREMQQMWASLMNGTYRASGTTAVAPLLTTKWDQSPYYNALCPQQGGTNTVAGCVAIAMAQVMKYWNWPVNGEGSHSYTLNTYGVQSADFETTTYEWANMPDKLDASSTQEQVNAVATLVYHAGVSVNMYYGLSGSSTDFNYSVSALKNYFRYAQSLYIINDHNEQHWLSSLHNELNLGRPVLEQGSSEAGGHYFICDGYDYNDLFHINWGWGGAYDGYFLHNYMHPNASYTFNDKYLVIGIEPNNRLRTDRENIAFSVTGGLDSVRVLSSILDSLSWNASSDQSWLTFAPTTGAGNGNVTTMTLTATPNNTDSIRYATVTIVQDTLTTSISVTQFNTELCEPVIMPWTEDFEDGTLPNCWSVLGDEQSNWTVAASDTNHYAKSLLPSDTTEDHWLVTPELLLYDNSVLTFRVFGNGTRYRVLLSTDLSSSDTSNFIMVGERTVGTTDTWEIDSLDLSAYTGDTVCIAFIHYAGANNPEFRLDDVALYKLAVQYHLTGFSADSTMGSVSGSGSFDAYTTTTLLATANNGYKFVRWTDNNKDNPRTVIMVEDQTYTAVFSNLGSSVISYSNGSATDAWRFDSYPSYWGVKFPPSSLHGYNSLQKIRLQVGDNGDYKLYAFQGDMVDDMTQLEPLTTFQITGTFSWRDVNLPSPMALDTTKPLWVIIGADGESSVSACYGVYSGNDNGCWLSEGDGSNWVTLPQINNYYTWMIRAVLSTGTGVEDVAQDIFHVYSTDNRIVVRNAEGQLIRIYDIMGREIVSVTNNESVRTFTMPASGVYVVSVGNDFHQKVIVKK